MFFGAALMWLVRLESIGGVSMGPGEGGAACFCIVTDSFSHYAVQSTWNILMRRLLDMLSARSVTQRNS